MKYLILFLLSICIYILLSKKEYFQNNKQLLEDTFPELIKDKKTTYLSDYKCTDFEDILI